MSFEIPKRTNKMKNRKRNQRNSNINMTTRVTKKTNKSIFYSKKMLRPLESGQSCPHKNCNQTMKNV